jgi:hypothetical protein
MNTIVCPFLGLVKPRSAYAFVEIKSLQSNSLYFTRSYGLNKKSMIYTPAVEANTCNIRAIALIKSELTAYKNSNRPPDKVCNIS